MIIQFENWYEYAMVALGVLVCGIYYIKYGESPSSRMQALQRLAKDTLNELNAVALTWKKSETIGEVPRPNEFERQLKDILQKVNQIRDEMVIFREETTHKIDRLEKDVKTLKGE